MTGLFSSKSCLRIKLILTRPVKWNGYNKQSNNFIITNFLKKERRNNDLENCSGKPA